MTDVLTPEQRKRNMSSIKSKDTKPEIKIRKMLWENGIRGYRIHYDLPGKPDIAFTKYKIAVFIDGCYWHKCPECFREPKTNTEFWMNKINGNVERDKKITKELEDSGWTVLRFWEHEVRKNPDLIIKKINNSIKSSF
ncbi:very short patch repair endonuclease [Methanoplanus sp. FWC-SCC4]|uniref:Very short patch repair endonuclease n=2 Tax=Methanochimaera problematica TaxID=2609417 RepID=A0AA97I4B9_9EURY|nr:very short patch repair endonuclease [Methanoplanus sp. FWC-SCC4]WOF16781.1 very short patch repair endonuclease [Methanoplanus sp. FWC-SCC4]